MIDPVLGGAVLFIALTAGTKTGRAAARNAAASGYKATEWKPPKTAIVHYSGKAGEALGKRFAATTRKTRRATMRLVEKRWNTRVNSATPPGSQPPIQRIKPPTRQPAPPGQASQPGPPGPAPPGSTPAQPGPAPTAPASPPPQQTGPTLVGPPGTWPTNVPRPASSPGQSSPVPPPPPAPVNGGAGPGAAPTRKPTGPARGAARSTMPAFSLDLERPTTDAEFLETCIVLGDVLRGLSKSVEEWAGDVAGLGLPGQVTAPLEAVAEGIGDAATAVTRSATAFADIFEEPREIASRGMKFTGEDAA